MSKSAKPITIRLIHWLVFVLFCIAVATGYRMTQASWSGVGIIDRPELFSAHVLSGLSICCLAVIWALLRLARYYKSRSKLGWWERAVLGSHIILLGLGSAIGFLGWFGHSARGNDYRPFDWFPVPHILPELGASYTVEFYAYHRLLVPYFLLLFALHIAATLFHVFVLKDETLRSMLFAKR